MQNKVEEDPIKEIRRIRDESAKQFRSLKVYLTHLETVPSATELLEEIERKKQIRKPLKGTNR